MATADVLDPTQPFTRTQALTAGLTDAELRRRDFVRLYRGVYLSRQAPASLEVRARGALLLAPSTAVISHHTAAALWGGSVPHSSSVHLTIARSQSFQTAGVRTHESDRARDTTFHRGIRMTTPEQTFIDLAANLDLVELVVLGDRMVRREVTTPQRLVRSADAWRGHHRGRVCRCAGLVRAGVDSPPESRLRMLVVLAGLPEPAVNHVVRDPDTGEWLRRFELAYRDLRIAIEYEGGSTGKTTRSGPPTSSAVKSWTAGPGASSRSSARDSSRHPFGPSSASTRPGSTAARVQRRCSATSGSAISLVAEGSAGQILRHV